ncbi:M48 family metallopeptidase [Candidatus Gracilibacteria bacterium]|nr:M48 family metallopeptidase [Candidatus Gracilibacteria bacterium]
MLNKDKYEKIELPINVADAQPHKPDIKWAGTMLGIGVGFFAFSFLVFHLFANFIVANISLEKERQIFGKIFADEIGTQKLSDYYTFSKKIPEFEKYNIFVSEDEQINAFAFPGGNILITTALIDSAEYEEEIFFVLAHEIGHVQLRHNLKALARNLPFKITLFFLGFDINLGITNLTDTALNTASRNAEEKADNIAVDIMKQNGLNPFCASSFFDEKEDSLFEFMSTHPTNNSRIQNIKKAGTGKLDFSDCTKINKQNLPLIYE